MYEHLGANFLSSAGADVVAQDWPMPVAVFIDLNRDVLAKFRAISPDTIILGRAMPDDTWRADGFLTVPNTINRLMGAHHRVGDLVDYWIIWNEPVCNSKNEVEQLALDTESVVLAVGGTMKLAIGGFATGNPQRLTWWEAFYPVMNLALRLGDHLVHVHEYWRGNGLYDSFQGWLQFRLLHAMHGNAPGCPYELDDYSNVHPEDVTTGWTSLLRMIPIVISECGCDLTELTPPGHDPWAWKQVEEYQTLPLAYSADLSRYSDAMNMAIPNLLGCAMFSWQSSDRWKNFGIEDTPVAGHILSTQPPPVPPKPEEVRSMIKGVHLPNNKMRSSDYLAYDSARLEGFKGMTFASDPEDAQALMVRDADSMVRLYDDRIRAPNHGVKAVQFCLKQEAPIRTYMKMGVKKFEIHNEPNHPSGIEGWGAQREDARRFNAWYQVVYGTLKEMFPDAEFGFPGLVPQVNDLMWWDECKKSIQMSDWVGFHGYWQFDNHTSRQWGMRHVYLWRRHPTKPMYVTECGDATDIEGFDTKAARLGRYASLLQRFPWIQGVYPFILSSHDPQWDEFAWVGQDGQIRPFVDWMRNLQELSIAERIIHAGHLVKRNGLYPKRSLAGIIGTTIHHSAVGLRRWEGAPVMADYHIKHYGWSGIGYTYYIDLDGYIYQLWPIGRKTNHTGGNNSQWVGICLDGAFTRGREPSDAQIASCNALIKHIAVDILERPADGIGLYEPDGPDLPFLVAGHNQLNDTVCPGPTYGNWRARLVSE